MTASFHPTIAIASAPEVHERLLAHGSSNQFPKLLATAAQARDEGKSFFELAPLLIKEQYSVEKATLSQISPKEAIVDLVARFAQSFPESSTEIRALLRALYDSCVADMST